jgi:hypothetical protein
MAHRGLAHAQAAARTVPLLHGASKTTGSFRSSMPSQRKPTPPEPHGHVFMFRMPDDPQDF